MLQGILAFAIFAALGAGGVTALVTGSLALAAVSYIGAGLSVMLALLASEFFFSDDEAERFAEEPALTPEPRG